MKLPKSDMTGKAILEKIQYIFINDDPQTSKPSSFKC